MDMTCWKRFDMVAVLFYTGNIKQRMDDLKRELDRVGLSDRVTWFYTFPSPFLNAFSHSVRVDPSKIDSWGAFSGTLGYYRILKTAFGTGANNVLVLEDDIRFRHDLSALSDGIDALPSDYDVAKLEWSYPAQYMRGFEEINKGNSMWYSWDRINPGGTGAVCYSRRGMEWKIGRMEEPADWGNLCSRLMTQDAYDTQAEIKNHKLTGYLAYPLLARQRTYGRNTLHGGKARYDHSGGLSPEMFG